jgi:hypothetical protein
MHPKSNNNAKVVIFLYNRFFDPLIQGNFWLYIDDYLKKRETGIDFHLVTYEDRRFPLTLEQHVAADRWRNQGLGWTRLSWHPGTGVRSKMADVVAGGWAVFSLRLRGYRYMVTLGSVAGTFAYVYSRLLFMRLFLYQFEPHSEYAIDNRMWPERSLVYKASHWLERKAAQFATSIASGTRFMQERLEQVWKFPGRFFKIATVANDRKFLFNAAERIAMRTELGLSDDKWLLFYPGKFGSLYYTDETAWMFRWLHELEPRLHFLIVTPHSDEEVHGIFDRAQVARGAYTVRHSDYANIHPYFFAADFAVIAVPPGPSKRFVSNIKVGEYLCAGLPFLITRGVSEDYLVATERGVGVVVDDFREADVKAAWPEIRRFLEMDPDARRAHCRAVGLDYRGFDALNPVFKAAMQHLIHG